MGEGVAQSCGPTGRCPAGAVDGKKMRGDELAGNSCGESTALSDTSAIGEGKFNSLEGEASLIVSLKSLCRQR